MKDKLASKFPIFFSILLHIVIFTLFFIRFTPSQQKPKVVAVINAVAINERQLAATTPKNDPKPEPTIQKPPISDTIRHIEQLTLKQPQIEKSSVHEATPPPEKEKIVPIKEQSAVDLQDPQSEIMALKKRQEAKSRAEQKKKNEQLAKSKREEAAKQLQKELALEMHSKEETSDKKNIQETELSANLSEEKKQLNESKAMAEQTGEVDKYKEKIIESISRKWLVPDIEDKELACQLLVHVGPGGVVINVEVLKESGNENLDRSARNAIMKASPLPVPEKSELFDNFRAMRLTFRPQGIISE